MHVVKRGCAVSLYPHPTSIQFCWLHVHSRLEQFRDIARPRMEGGGEGSTLPYLPAVSAAVFSASMVTMLAIPVVCHTG